MKIAIEDLGSTICISWKLGEKEVVGMVQVSDHDGSIVHLHTGRRDAGNLARGTIIYDTVTKTLEPA